MNASTDVTGSSLRRHSLLSMPEIAELAGVHRPVVTTWRRRHPDFPAQVAGEAGRPLFDMHQVGSWLVRTGRAEAGQLEPELSLYALAALSRVLPPLELMAALTALVCLRYLDDDEPLADGTDDIAGALTIRAARLDPDNLWLAAEVRALRPAASELAPLVDDLVEAAWGCAGAFERIMAARGRFNAVDLFADAVTPPLARLMAELSGVRERARLSWSPLIADLAVGPGDLLAAAADLLGSDHTPMFTGAESDDYLARLARRRLLVHGIPAVDLDIRSGADLPDDAGEPDAIITQIPYVPGEDRAADDIIARLDDISVRLPAGRTAVVLGPASVLAGELPPYSPAERRRSDLIKSDLVEAVIQLPGGLLPFRPGYLPALWVLTPAFGSQWAGRVLLAEVSDRPLTDDVVDGLVADVVTWRRDGYQPPAHTRRFSTQEFVSDLVEPPGPLRPRRPRGIHVITTSAHARVARIAEVQAELARLASAAAARDPASSGIGTGTLRLPQRISIGTLAARKRLQLLRGTRLRAGDVGPGGQHAVLGPDEILGVRRAGELKIDRGVLAARYPHAKLTDPGDVIVTTVPALGAIVDDAGFAVVSFPARAVRIPEAERSHFTPRVLAALIGASGGAQRPAGSIRLAHRLEDLDVPMLDPAELLELDELLARLDGRRQDVQQELDLLAELRQIATSGLADGTLTFTSDPA